MKVLFIIFNNIDEELKEKKYFLKYSLENLKYKFVDLIELIKDLFSKKET